MKAFRVLFVSSELAPLTGDEHPLAREVSFLARALAALDVDTTVVVPGHRVPVPTRFGLARRLAPLAVSAGGLAGDFDTFDATFHEGTLGDGRVKLLAIDLPAVIEEDPARRDRAFCRAAMTLATRLELRPDAVWAGPGTEPALALARTELAVDGVAPVTLYALRDPDDPDAIAVAAHADRLVVTSPTLAQRLAAAAADDAQPGLPAPERERVRGILSGMDALTWDRRGDGLDRAELGASKAAHKRALKQRLGLRGGAQAPLLALCGPVDPDILGDDALAELSRLDLTIVVAADPVRDAALCRRIDDLAGGATRRGRLVVHTEASAEALRRFEGELLCAADLVLCARTHAPNTLSELYPMYYGVAPVAPRTAVYADHLVDFDLLSVTGTGFLFDPTQPGQLVAAVRRALKAFLEPRAFATLSERAADFDLSWRAPAIRWLELVQEVEREREAARDAQAAAS
ncbi:glycogen/starch synthase [Haliangium sp.]|uniref:glycogen/starch synthase n=1 Tax=Haliangium sp. TaxID=2663208 RepID=UPI003D14B2BA